MKAFFSISIAIATGALISACGTYNSWTPKARTSVDAYNERSCASGYSNCDFRGGSHDSNGNAHGFQMTSEQMCTASLSTISFSLRSAAYPLDSSGARQQLRGSQPKLRATSRSPEVSALFQRPKLQSGTARIPATVQPVSASSARDRGLLQNVVASSPQLNPNCGVFK